MPMPFRATRRTVCGSVASVGSLAVAGVAGCLNRSRTRLIVGVGPAGSRSYDAGQALAFAVDRHSDTVEIVIRETADPRERLQAIDGGPVSVVGVDNTTLYRIHNDIAPFDETTIGTVPQQGFSYGRLEQCWLTTNNDLDSTADLQTGGWSLYPIQPGFRSRLATEQLLHETALWEPNDVYHVPVGQVPAAIDAGEIEVVAVSSTNGQQLADWCRELDQQVGDQLRPLSVGDEFAAATDTAPNTIPVDADTTGFVRASLPETVSGWAVPSQWLFSPTVDPAVSEEIARIVADHGETLVQADPLAGGWTASEPMGEAVISDYPIHPGVATFFEDRDVFDDGWQRGEHDADSE